MVGMFLADLAERHAGRSTPFAGYIAANGFYPAEHDMLCVIFKPNVSGTMFALSPKMR